MQYSATMYNKYLLVNTIMIMLSLTADSLPSDYSLQSDCPPKCICILSIGNVTADCQSQEMTSIPKLFPQKLKKLSFKNNILMVLKNGTFKKSHFTQLKELELQENRINLIHEHAFDGLHSLLYLNLSSNRIKTLSSNMFLQLDKLELLDVRNNTVHCKFLQNGLTKRIQLLCDTDQARNADTTTTNKEANINTMKTEITTIAPIVLKTNINTMKTEITTIAPIVLKTNINTMKTEITSIEPIVLKTNINTMKTEITSIEPIVFKTNINTMKTEITSIEPIVSKTNINAMKTEKTSIESIVSKTNINTMKTEITTMAPIVSETTLNTIRETEVHNSQTPYRCSDVPELHTAQNDLNIIIIILLIILTCVTIINTIFKIISWKRNYRLRNSQYNLVEES